MKSRIATRQVAPYPDPGLLPAGGGLLRSGQPRSWGVLLDLHTCSEHPDLSTSRTIDVGHTAKRAEIMEFTYG